LRPAAHRSHGRRPVVQDDAGITGESVELSAGYRLFHVDIQEATNVLEFGFRGPFVALSLKLGN
jgi:hypothetical protein